MVQVSEKITPIVPMANAIEDFLVIKDVKKSFPLADGGEYVVLNGVNLTVKQGEFICIIGHSGCGKSTLLNMVSGFSMPTSGTVLSSVDFPQPECPMMQMNSPCLTVRFTPFRTTYSPPSARGKLFLTSLITKKSSIALASGTIGVIFSET